MLIQDATLLLADDHDATALEVIEAPATFRLQRVIGAPGSHLCFPRAVVPQIRLEIAAGTHLLISWFGASTDRAAIERDLAEAHAIDPGVFNRLRDIARPPKGWNRTAAVASAFLAQRDLVLNGPAR